MSALALVYLVHYLVAPLQSEVSCFNLTPVCYPLEHAMLNARRHACPQNIDCAVDCAYAVGDSPVMGRRDRLEGYIYDLLPALQCRVEVQGHRSRWLCSTSSRRCWRR